MQHIASPDNSDAGMDRQMEASGATAPRITNDDVLDNIVDVDYVKYVSKSGQVLRWAVLTTKSGFAVTGRPSAAVSPENDNVAIGEKVAYDNAKQELWPMMGYALKNDLWRASLPKMEQSA